ncbi:MAG: GGDEF and EAL domain-containing protein [Ruminococcus sp.]|nr:GGDEF and EAL domain-containing protein [Ruminococcus sp.]MBR1863851.1 GGDEF and EAL domain-containing protein [Ruminococcus sp.]
MQPKLSDIELSSFDSRLFEGFASTSLKRYVYMCDMTTNISRWSRNAVEYFGLPDEYMYDAGSLWAEHIHPDDRQMYLDDIGAVFDGRQLKHEIDYRARNDNGEYVLCTCHGVVMKGKDGEHDLFVGTLENHGIADNVDAATSLYNVYEFLQYIKELKEGGRSALELLIGINSFSEINDMYSYAFGDRVLNSVGVRLQEILGNSRRIYRMDGVKFAVFFPEAEIPEIYDIYRKIQYEMKYNVFVDGIRIPISVSAGAVLLSGDFDEFSAQGSARYALEHSKVVEHGELYVFDDELKGTNRKKLELISAMRKSMLAGYDGFFMCYQPLISSEKEKLIGAEALLRWQGEGFGVVMPGVFIPLLENDPSFFDLGNWILRKAMSESLHLVENDPEFVLNVNISYTQLSHQLFRESVKAIMSETGFPAGNLCMELTESCRQLDKSFLARQINFLTGLGIKIAIDDFGTGFSSLNLLSELPVETLKFDRGFTKDIITNKVNQTIIKAITECAKELHVHVCLEGMENREMIEFSKRFCVYSYQGYYYSRPIVIKQFDELYYGA